MLAKHYAHLVILFFSTIAAHVLDFVRSQSCDGRILQDAVQVCMENIGKCRSNGIELTFATTTTTPSTGRLISDDILIQQEPILFRILEETRSILRIVKRCGAKTEKGF